MNTDGTGFSTCTECHKTESLWNHTTTDHKEGKQLEDRRNVGESSCNFGDGTDQRVQSLMFMIMMMSWATCWPVPVSSTKLIRSQNSCKYVYALVSTLRNVRRGLSRLRPQLPPRHHEGWSGGTALYFPHFDTRWIESDQPHGQGQFSPRAIVLFANFIGNIVKSGRFPISMITILNEISRLAFVYRELRGLAL